MTAEYKICEEKGAKLLLLTGPWKKEYRRVMQASDILGLRLSAYAGWNEQSIDFVRELPFLRTLDLMSTQIRDVTPLYDLPNLRALSITGVTRRIDFTKISHLQDPHLRQWRRLNYDSLFDCRHLTNLGVSGFPEHDLNRFASLPQLENLAVSFSKIETLEGVADLPGLIRLSLAQASRLQTFKGLEGSRQLLLLWLEGAKRLSNIGLVGSVTTLRTLNLTDCPDLESLRPLRGLPELEAVWFYGSTNVRDGDLSPLTSLPKLKYAKFVDRKHYTHKNQDFPKSSNVFQ